jgi:hypothetical protein
LNRVYLPAEYGQENNLAHQHNALRPDAPCNSQSALRDFWLQVNHFEGHAPQSGKLLFRGGGKYRHGVHHIQGHGQPVLSNKTFME